jgi:hypothetical protein
MSMDYHATRSLGDRKASMSRWLVLSVWLFGCSSSLEPARQAFAEARYPDAVAEFRALGAQLPELGRAERFEYALYRGLSHLALGDARPAERWLLIAKRLSEASPGLATPEEQGRLLSAWSSMGHMPGD